MLPVTCSRLWHGLQFPAFGGAVYSQKACLKPISSEAECNSEKVIKVAILRTLLMSLAGGEVADTKDRTKQKACLERYRKACIEILGVLNKAAPQARSLPLAFECATKMRANLLQT